MALYAYKDKGRTEIIYAVNAMKKDIEERYYCPNPSCNAHLHICAVDGSKKSYFRATKSKYGHVRNCAMDLTKNLMQTNLMRKNSLLTKQ